MAPSSSADAPRTSALAIASLVVGALMCVPFGGLVAVILAATAIALIRKAEGRLEGTSFAVAGVALGLFNLALSGAVTAAMMIEDDPPAVPPAVTAVAPPPPTATAPHAGAAEEGQMTMINEVTEVTVGAVRLVDVPPTKRSLEAELEAQRAKAAASGERLVLFTSAESCRPCLSVAAILADPKMQTALKQVRLVRVDVNALSQELDELGVSTRPPVKIPGFYLLGKNHNPIDGIHGGEWDDDTPDNAAPVLGAFVQGTYKKRREPFTPQPRRQRPPPPRPMGTFL